MKKLSNGSLVPLSAGYLVAVVTFWLLAPAALGHPQTQLRFPQFQTVWPVVLLTVGIPTLALTYGWLSPRGWKFWTSIVSLGVALPLIAVVAGHVWAGTSQDMLIPIGALIEILLALVLISWAKFNSLLSYLIVALAPLASSWLKRKGDQSVGHPPTS